MKTLRIMFAVAAMTALAAVSAFADTAVAAGETVTAVSTAATMVTETVASWIKLPTAGLCIALAAVGCATAMGRAITAAFEGVGRNPSAGQRMMTMMILGLALIESLAIYSLVIAIMILNK